MKFIPLSISLHWFILYNATLSSFYLSCKVFTSASAGNKDDSASGTLILNTGKSLHGPSGPVTINSGNASGGPAGSVSIGVGDSVRGLLHAHLDISHATPKHSQQLFANNVSGRHR